MDRFVGRGDGKLKTLMVSVFLTMLKSVCNGITGLAKNKRNTVDNWLTHVGTCLNH